MSKTVSEEESEIMGETCRNGKPWNQSKGGVSPSSCSKTLSNTVAI